MRVVNIFECREAAFIQRMHVPVDGLNMFCALLTLF